MWDRRGRNMETELIDKGMAVVMDPEVRLGKGGASGEGNGQSHWSC